MKLDKIFCDSCNGEVENSECMKNQLRFVLLEQMDDGKEYHFCGAECLKEFVSKKEFENRFYRWRKLSEVRE